MLRAIVLFLILFSNVSCSVVDHVMPSSLSFLTPITVPLPPDGKLHIRVHCNSVTAPHIRTDQSGWNRMVPTSRSGEWEHVVDVSGPVYFLRVQVNGSGRQTLEQVFIIRHPVATIYVAPETLWSDGHLVLGAVLFDKNGKQQFECEDRRVRWISSDRKIATVADGMVRRIAIGKVVITASCDGVNYSYVLEVPKPVQSAIRLTISPSFKMAERGAGASFSVHVSGHHGTLINWSSKNPDIASVANTQKGECTFATFQPGRVEIRAVCICGTDCNLSGSAVLDVSSP